MTNQHVCNNYNDEDHNNDSTIFLINNKIGFKIESFAHDIGSRKNQAVQGQINITSTTSIITGNIIIDDYKTISSRSSYTQPIMHRSLLKNQQQQLQNTANNDNKIDKSFAIF